MELTTPFDGLQPHVHPHVAAALHRAGLTGWMSEGVGKWSLPLQFIPGGGWVELMRLAPGTVLTRHHHHGEVHAVNLQGQRRLDDGQIVGPGDYVFEPAGNTDSWAACGNQILVLHVVVRGDVDYVAGDGHVQCSVTTERRLAEYRAYCVTRGLTPRLG